MEWQPVYSVKLGSARFHSVAWRIAGFAGVGQGVREAVEEAKYLAVQRDLSEQHADVLWNIYLADCDDLHEMWVIRTGLTNTLFRTYVTEAIQLMVPEVCEDGEWRFDQ